MKIPNLNRLEAFKIDENKRALGIPRDTYDLSGATLQTIRQKHNLTIEAAAAILYLSPDKYVLLEDPTKRVPTYYPFLLHQKLGRTHQPFQSIVSEQKTFFGFLGAQLAKASVHPRAVARILNIQWRYFETWITTDRYEYSSPSMAATEACLYVIYPDYLIGGFEPVALGSPEAQAYVEIELPQDATSRYARRVDYIPPTSDQVKTLRYSLQKTQKQMAHYLQISLSTYQKYELRETSPQHRGVPRHLWEALAAKHTIPQSLDDTDMKLKIPSLPQELADAQFVDPDYIAPSLVPPEDIDFGDERMAIPDETAPGKRTTPRVPRPQAGLSLQQQVALSIRANPLLATDEPEPEPGAEDDLGDGDNGWDTLASSDADTLDLLGDDDPLSPARLARDREKMAKAAGRGFDFLNPEGD